ACACRAPVDDLALGDAGRFVDRLAERLAVDEIDIVHRSVDFGEDRPRIRIPLGNALAAAHDVAIVHLEPAAIGNAVHGPFRAVLVDHGYREVAGHDHELALRTPHDLAVLDLYGPFEVRFDERLLGKLRRAADMERAHGELRARLA